MESDAFAYARAMAQVENVVAVVSDLRGGSSRIYAGAFAGVIGLEDYSEESSIWEKKILSKMNAAEQEEKFLAELRFLNYIRRMPARRRRNYYLVSRLRFNGRAGVATDVLHRMYYISEGDSIRFAVCLYGPLPPRLQGAKRGRQLRYRHHGGAWKRWQLRHAEPTREADSAPYRQRQHHRIDCCRTWDKSSHSEPSPPEYTFAPTGQKFT